MLAAGATFLAATVGRDGLDFVSHAGQQDLANRIFPLPAGSPNPKSGSHQRGCKLSGQAPGLNPSTPG
jgi:hypothetical protein